MKSALKTALSDTFSLNAHPNLPNLDHHVEGCHGPAANDLPNSPTTHNPQPPAAEKTAGNSGHQPTENPANSGSGAERAPSHTTEPSTPAHTGQQADAPTTTQVQRDLDRIEELVKQNNGDVDAALDQFARDRQPELVGTGARDRDMNPTASAGDVPNGSGRFDGTSHSGAEPSQPRGSKFSNAVQHESGGSNHSGGMPGSNGGNTGHQSLDVRSYGTDHEGTDLGHSGHSRILISTRSKNMRVGALFLRSREC